ncbi:poly(ADP-ribose) glycohydrolase-like [Oppia nitens]|uniref:poly(ADP-ribose) glycohydrolase-like n=1 Tax=Oppia nitens TaxID=1686743 RepID=UPI0023DBA77B|nr:poly(ADP-ribose) glycohydrolase-like [Oppia nitens]
MTSSDQMDGSKRLRQTSIEDFVIVVKRKTSATIGVINDNDNRKDNNTAAADNGHQLLPAVAMNTSDPMADSNIGQQTSAADQQMSVDDNNPTMTTTTTTDDVMSIELSDWSETSDISEIPETPPDGQQLATVLDTISSRSSSSSTSDDDDSTAAFKSLNRMPGCLQPLSPLTTGPHYYILYRISDNNDVSLDISGRRLSPPKPFPNHYTDKWDAKHVKMPNSPNNQITAVEQTSDGQVIRRRQSKWELIEKSLLIDIKCVEQLEETMKTYNPFVENYNFNVLRTFLNDNCDQRERSQFFDEILPKMIQLTLQLPAIVTQSVPMLKQRQNATLFLSQQQISCLLANAFFCTFPKRSHTNEEYKNFPVINFLSLFTNYGYDDNSQTKIEKLKCIINYFRRVVKDPPTGVVSFERRYRTSDELPVWQNSMKSLRKLVTMKNGFIENEGKGLLQVDFANKYIGGGVLGGGCVQEEIRFAICPELIVARLFTERLLNNEVLVMNGCEQFSEYTGYANSFMWTNDYRDDVPFDEWGRRLTRIVAIDALYFTYSMIDSQYDNSQIERELNKAYIGFMDTTTTIGDCDPKHKCAIASGNWGCGAFNGDPELKAVIQLMAATEADRDLVLFTFGDSRLKKKLNKFYTFSATNGFKVKHLSRALKLYQQNRKSKAIKKSVSVLDFIINCCSDVVTTIG